MNQHEPKRVIEINRLDYESETLSRLKDAAKSKNTKRAYAAVWKRFESWLAGRTPNDRLLAEYIAELHDRGKSPATLSQTAAAIRSRDKTLVGEHTAHALAGARRNRQPRGRGQMHGVTWIQVEKVCGVCEAAGTLAGLRDSALFRVMSDCLLRVSEVAAISTSDLKLEDNALIVAASKTDQEARGETLYIGDETVAALRAYIDRYTRSGGIDHGLHQEQFKALGDWRIFRYPLFRRINRGDNLTTELTADFEHDRAAIETSGLSPEAIRKIIKKRLTQAKIPGKFSGHSLRIGSAVSLAQAGATVVDMQTAGRWKSADMPAHYAAAQLANRGAIARFKYRK